MRDLLLMADVERCREKVHDWGRGVGFHPCLNPAKKNGLCGVHLRQAEQRIIGDAERERLLSFHDEQIALGKAEADRLCMALGITTAPYWPHSNGSYSKTLERPFSGKLIISVADLERLAKALADA